MLLHLVAAEALLTDLTREAPLRVNAAYLLDGYSFARHGYALIGTVAVEGIKERNRWHVQEEDLRRAAGSLCELVLDRADLVPLDLSWTAMTDVSYPPSEMGWRGVVRDMVCKAVIAAPGPLDTADLFEPGLTRAERARLTELVQLRRDRELLILDLATKSSRRPKEPVDPGDATDRPVVIDGTFPSDMLVRKGRRWQMPRAYVELLDLIESQNKELTDRAEACTRCGTRAAKAEVSRHSTSKGWLSICRRCATTAYAVYQGELDGVRYTTSLRHRSRADAYLCTSCATAPAAAWDHCHDHGYLRSPCCNPCNTAEGVNLGWWLDRPGGVEHLLRCRGCREARTLPARYRGELIRRHLVETARHPSESGRGTCRSKPFAHPGVIAADGTATFGLWCRTHSRNIRDVDPARWEVTVALADYTHLVDAFLTPWLPPDDTATAGG